MYPPVVSTDGRVFKLDRYKIMTSELSKVQDLNVDKAFEILDEVKQVSGEWVTALSIVYSKKANSVYYCFDGDFTKRYEYSFPNWLRFNE